MGCLCIFKWEKQWGFAGKHGIFDTAFQKKMAEKISAMSKSHKNVACSLYERTRKNLLNMIEK